MMPRLQPGTWLWRRRHPAAVQVFRITALRSVRLLCFLYRPFGRPLEGPRALQCLLQLHGWMTLGK